VTRSRLPAALLGGLLAACAGPEPAPLARCDEGRLAVVLTAADDALSLCAGVATTEAERAAGLTAWPELDDGTGLWLQFPVEGELCITTAVLDYAIDVVFVDQHGAITSTACARGPTDPLACVDAAHGVLELLPRSGCDMWPGGHLTIGPPAE
jgi:uncharacterized membrane protein (UPF0127 family)